jgi:hypothetical protein
VGARQKLQVVARAYILVKDTTIRKKPQDLVAASRLISGLRNIGTMSLKRQRATDTSRHSTVTPRNHRTWWELPTNHDERPAWIPIHMLNWHTHRATPDVYGPTERGQPETAQRRWYDENLGWVMSNTGRHNNRAARYGPNDPRGDRESYHYVYWIYTALRHWMRRAIRRVREAAAKRARLPQIIGNRGGRWRPSVVCKGRDADDDYRYRLRPVLGLGECRY